MTYADGWLDRDRMTTERKYLPTIADLIDRLSISLMKSIFIANAREHYHAEMKLLMEDIWSFFTAHDLDRKEDKFIYAVLVLMLANATIWQNEGDIRTTPMTDGKPDGYKDIAQRLIFTHSINGVRTRAKNEINKILGERWDAKVDCLAADLPPQFGNWDVFK